MTFNWGGTTVWVIPCVQMSPLPKKKIGRTEFLLPIFISGRGDVCTQAIWVISAKKMSCRLISKENNSYTEKISLMAYKSGKKSHTCVRQEKKFYHLTFGKKFLHKANFHRPPPPNPQKSNTRPLRTFRSARFPHNVFIWVSLHKWSVLKAVAGIYSNGRGKANRKILGKTQSPKGTSDTFNIQEKRYWRSLP